MGKLVDITSQAANTPKNHTSSPRSHWRLQSPAVMDQENLGKSKSPHFMTPTFSSSKQTTSTSNKLKGPTSTPEPARPVKVDGMMKSAAKRVGFRRAGDGTPRSKKEGLAKQTKALSFPDKFATPSRENVSDSPPSSQKPAPKPSPKDKPLPSPPVARVHSSNSSMESSRSLIDASDKPLQRSQSGLLNRKEVWPVLQPQRPSSPGTLREMMLDTGTELTQQLILGQQERYPILGNTTLRQVPEDDQLPISRYSEQHRISRKEVSSPKVQKSSGENAQMLVQVNQDEKQEPSVQKPVDDPFQDEKNEATAKRSMDDPFRDGVYNTDLTNGSHKIISPSIPAVSKPTLEPRQNRTSFQRARLSAGQTAKNGQSKVSGGTDTTDLKEGVAGAGQKGSLRARKETQAHRSITPPVGPTLQAKSSKESIGGNRAPAKFVAGSRRTSNNHRPSSRGSLRDEARAPSPPRSSLPPPSRAAPNKPSLPDLKTSNVEKQVGANSNARTSSIPVPRKSSSTHNPGEENGKPSSVDVGKSPKKKEARNESSIFGDHSSQDFMNDLEATPPPRPSVNRLAPFLLENKDTPVLESIEESPQHAYQTKRLSMNSPNYGPTLKISPSAEHFIMGSCPRKGDRPASKKSSKEFGRSISKNGMKSRKSGSSSTSSAEKLPDRPSSSQGLSRLGSRVGLIDPAVREKKVKSADVTLTSPKVLDSQSAGVTQKSNGTNETKVSVRGSATSTGTAPSFFDAPEEQVATGITEATSDVNTKIGQSGPSEEMWISPLNVKASRDAPSADEGSCANLHKPTLNQGLQRAIDTDDTDPFDDNNTVRRDFADQAKEATTRPVIQTLPSTPQRSHHKAGTQLDILPPRSSSRMAPPDWAGDKKPPSPPITIEKIPLPTPPKPTNFAHRQNELGSQRGHGSSQLDLKSLPSKHNSLRDSTTRAPSARESHNSQASLPKGNSVLFNLKGLFHPKSGAKHKVTINRNGSPYPPITDIHPIHRPTLASTNRFKPSTPNRKNPNIQATPSYASPIPTDVSQTTAMAMQILDAARTEASSPKKERLLKLGQVMVQAITQARDAEKAMEEAKQAARKAEVAHVLCQKSLSDVNQCVQEWRGSQVLDGRF